MHIVVKAYQEQKRSFLAKGIPTGIQVTWLIHDADVPVADAYFDLVADGPAFLIAHDKPVFINEVVRTGKNLPTNFVRLNGWNSFFERPVIEIAAGKPGPEAENILQTLGWKYQWVADEPGFISARIVSMVINEAYFGLGDDISTKAEIDIAMKLGTNYPYGPFEWAEIIGVKRVYDLLEALSETDKRYEPAVLLKQESSNN